MIDGQFQVFHPAHLQHRQSSVVKGRAMRYEARHSHAVGEFQHSALGVVCKQEAGFLKALANCGDPETKRVFTHCRDLRTLR